MKLFRVVAVLFSLTLLALGHPALALADSYADIAKDLVRNPGEWSGKRVAVVPFRYMDNRPSDDGGVIAAGLETEIVRRSVLQVVERAELDKVVGEMVIQQSGALSAETAQKLGQLAGAELLITGTLTEAGKDKIDVRAKLIRVETGDVLRSASATIRRTWAKPTQTTSVVAPSPVSSAAASPGPPPIPEGIRVSVIKPAATGAVRRVGDRDLAFRSTYDGSRPLLRITDYTDPGNPIWTEVDYGGSSGFSLTGRRYRRWWDKADTMHVVPKSGLFGVVESAEVLLSHYDFRETPGHFTQCKYLREQFESGNMTCAYVEPVHKGGVRVSLFDVECMETSPNGCAKTQMRLGPPMVSVTLPARAGVTTTSRIVTDGRHYYRFHYGGQDVVVEEVAH